MVATATETHRHRLRAAPKHPWGWAAETRVSRTGLGFERQRSFADVPRARSETRLDRRCRNHRQVQRERRAATWLGFHRDGTARAADSAEHDRQAEPRSGLALGREKRLEDLLACGRVHA